MYKEIREKVFVLSQGLNVMSPCFLPYISCYINFENLALNEVDLLGTDQRCKVVLTNGLLQSFHLVKLSTYRNVFVKITRYL